MPAVSTAAAAARLPIAPWRAREVDQVGRSADDAVVTLTTVEIPTRVLVFGMVRPDGTVLAAELYPVAEACGQTAEQVRSCLRRLVAEGLHRPRGRRAHGRVPDDRRRATPASAATIERTRLAYVQDARAGAGTGGGGSSPSPSPRAGGRARDRLRDRLTRARRRGRRNGLYVSPHPWQKDVEREAERLGVADRLTVASTDDLEVAGVRPPRASPGRSGRSTSWPPRYERFLDEFHDTVPLARTICGPTSAGSRHRVPARRAAMVVAFQEVFDDDPLLPPELLPATVARASGARALLVAAAASRCAARGARAARPVPQRSTTSSADALDGSRRRDHRHKATR